MIVNFRARRISRGECKLTRTPTLILKKNYNVFFKKLYLGFGSPRSQAYTINLDPFLFPCFFFSLLFYISFFFLQIRLVCHTLICIVVKIMSYLLKSYGFTSQHVSNMLNRTKNSKLVKSDLTRTKSEKSINSVNLVRLYEFTKAVTWTKLGSNLTLKYLLTSFARLNISFKLYIG